MNLGHSFEKVILQEIWIASEHWWPFLNCPNFIKFFIWHTNQYRPLFGDSEVITLESFRVLRSTFESTVKPIQFQQGNNFAAGKATHLPDIQLPSKSFRRALINVVLVLKNDHVFKTHGVAGYGTLKFETPPISNREEPSILRLRLGYHVPIVKILDKRRSKHWDNRKQHVHLGCLWDWFHNTQYIKLQFNQIIQLYNWTSKSIDTNACSNNPITNNTATTHHHYYHHHHSHRCRRRPQQQQQQQTKKKKTNDCDKRHRHGNGNTNTMPPPQQCRFPWRWWQ